MHYSWYFPSKIVLAPWKWLNSSLKPLTHAGGGVINLPPTGHLDGEETSTCVLPASPSSCVRPGQEWPSGRGLLTVWARKSAGLIPPNQEPSQSVHPKSPLSPAPMVWVVTGSWGIRAAVRWAVAVTRHIPAHGTPAWPMGRDPQTPGCQSGRRAGRVAFLTFTYGERIQGLVHRDRLTRAKRSNVRNRQACC